MTSNMRTVGGKVHNHDGSCIYSIENQMGTLFLSTRTWSGFKLLQLKSYRTWLK